MYRAIVAARTRAIWKRINARDIDAPVGMAAEEMRFTFVGDTPLGASFTGREKFRAWFEAMFERFPGIAFEVRDVAVAGWPWHTRVALRLGISMTLADGTDYENEAVQWITLRWGKMLDDWVIEDTLALADACRRQEIARATATRS